jgi:hypothetical protein
MYDVIAMKSIAENLNDLTYTDYFYRLMLLSRSVFKWEGLPNGIDEKWIERYLFADGKCMFFHDNEKGFMVAKCNPAGDLNQYDEPTILKPHGTNYQYTGEGLENNVDCVLIRNNDEMIPTSPTIQIYALKLAELSRTIDINIHAQKTPVIILCSEKQKLTMKNVYRQWNGYEPIIYGDKNLDIEGIKVLKTDAPIVFDKLQLQKHAVWNECMTFLGINNANMDKRERLVDDEVQANNEQIEMSAEIFLKARQMACKRINEIFGLNVSVSIRKAEEWQILKDKEGIECQQDTPLN